MRDCTDFVNKLKKVCPEEYTFIKEKLQEEDENSNKLYFLGIREGYMNLYYMGHSMAKIELGDEGLICTMSNWYLNGLDSSIKKKIVRRKTRNEYEDDENLKGQSVIAFENFKDNKIFYNIKNQIKKHVMGEHDKKWRREKVCQQWIMNMNNNDDKSDWYYIDMEYVYDKNPYGRFDMIAVKKQSNENGLHDVALIELKVGRDAYGGIGTELERKNKEKYDKYRKNVYTDIGSKERVNFGSGIVSHIIDYFRFLYNHESYAQLQEEIVKMIDGHREFGLLDKCDNISSITDKNQLSLRPDIYMLSYLYVPCWENNDHEIKESNITIEQMKRSFGNFLFHIKGEKTSKYCLEEMLSRDQIEGILKMRDGYKDFINNSQNESIICVQEINRIPYSIIIRFVNPAGKKDSWHCL